MRMTVERVKERQEALEVKLKENPDLKCTHPNR